MKKELLAIGIVGLVLSGFSSVSAQHYISKKLTDNQGKVHMVTFKENAVVNAKATELIKEVLSLPANVELKLKKSDKDASGKFLDEKYQMYYNNILVENAVYNLHYVKGKITSLNGDFFNTESVNTNPSLSSESAFQKAVESVSAAKYMWEEGYQDIDYNKKPTGDLVLLPLQNKDETYTLKLAYKFDIFAAQPLSRANIYIDAVTGRVLLSDAIIKHASQNTPNFGQAQSKESAQERNLRTALSKLSNQKTLVAGTAETRYSGTRIIETTLSNGNYILHDTTRGNGVRTYNIKNGTNTGSAVDFTDADNVWSKAEFDNDAFDNAALDAHWGVSKTYDYFLEKHNRDSYNGSGALLRSYVHYQTAYENASWNGSYMVYGDGASTFAPLVAFDVTAHELGHGVNSASAALLYQRESGALNEGFSDIWGATVENYAAPEKDPWLIGEEITKVKPFHLRSMKNPKDVGQPDTYRGAMWRAATVEEGCITPGRDTNDYCGVHSNSGVLNHWYYILVTGKAGKNDIGNVYNVTGIGFEKAGKIAYRMETNYLSGNSTYAQAKDYGIQAAKDLFGADSPEAIATQDAFYAVGLGSRYSPADSVAPTTPLNLEASSTTNVSTYLTWTASTDNFSVDGYDVYKDGVLLGYAKTNSYYVTGLTQSTAYKFKVQAKDVAGNKSDFSNELTVTTASSGYAYCASQSNNTNVVAFQRIQINTIDDTVGTKNGYDDFSYLTTDVEKGKTYNVTITPIFGTLPQFSARYRIFIDYNNNGVLTESNEIAFTQLASTNPSVSGTITIPENAVTANTRMRVSIANGTTPTACQTIGNGQVRDFSINIVDKLAVSDVNSSNKIAIYPNPVKDVLFISSKNNEDASFRIYNTAGQVVSTGKTVNNSVNVNKIPVGNYILELTDKNGEKSSQKFIKK